MAFRKKLYTSLDEIQKDLDGYMYEYNHERTNQGKRCQGRTPIQTLRDCVPLYHQYVKEGEINQENKKAVENNPQLH